MFRNNQTDGNFCCFRSYLLTYRICFAKPFTHFYCEWPKSNFYMFRIHFIEVMSGGGQMDQISPIFMWNCWIKISNSNMLFILTIMKTCRQIWLEIRVPRLGSGKVKNEGHDNSINDKLWLSCAKLWPSFIV